MFYFYRLYPTYKGLMERRSLSSAGTWASGFLFDPMVSKSITYSLVSK